MKKHKVGDKFVIEIDKVFSQDGETLYRAKGMKSLVFDEYGLNILKPLSAYTDPLETKIRRQASHITYLEGKIKELKSDLKHGRTIEDDRDPEAERAAGQQEAWELAKKIVLDIDNGGYSTDELRGIFVNGFYQTAMIENTYAEAAAKVEAWERQEEEIRVVDIVHVENIHGTYGIVTCIDGCNITLMLKNGVAVYRNKNACHKTGRHIDVSAMLGQIGGGNDEK